MAIPADVDTTPTPGPRMPRLACACGADFRALRRPDAGVLAPWLDGHGAHDPTLRARADETWQASPTTRQPDVRALAAGEREDDR